MNADNPKRSRHRRRRQQAASVTPLYGPHPVGALPHVLVAEDDDDMRALLVHALRKGHYRVSECSDGWGLLAKVNSYLSPETGRREEKIDLIISDIRMPGLTGMELLDGVEGIPGFPPMILITAFGDEDTHRRAHRLGAVTFDKPFDLDDLLSKVHELVPETEEES
jgi:CheY-like chemotaxis protein